MKGAEKTTTAVIPGSDNDFIVLLRRVIFLLVALALALSAQAAGLQEAASVSKALPVHIEQTALPPIHPTEATPHSLILEQLRRLPAAIMQVNPPSLWQERRGLILGIIAVVALQSALIAGLLVNRATRRRAERALAESEGRMSLATESANLGLWVWDIVRDEFWVTPRFRSMFGFRARRTHHLRRFPRPLASG